MIELNDCTGINIIIEHMKDNKGIIDLVNK